MSATATHAAVLLPEVLTALNIRASGAYLDATFGRGGHAGAMLEKLSAEGRLLCLDRDPRAIAEARARFGADPRVHIFHAPFSRLAACADRVREGLELDGILLDVGVSSPQLDDPERGFSFLKDGPLDMRMSEGEGASAADVVNRAPEAELKRIFREYGEERFAGRIARAIVADRAVRPFTRTGELAGLIERVVRAAAGGRGGRRGRGGSEGAPGGGGGERSKHPATRVFQALRIHVNQELEELGAALEAARSRLAPHGRLAVISFHSLEDRMVKQFLRRHSSVDPVYAGLPVIPATARPTLRLVGRSIEPSPEEIARNPRSRSARLRVAERIAPGDVA